MEDFIERLKQRKLVQWALAYAAAAFALIQVLDIVAQRFGWPESVERFTIVAMAVGFFVALVLAWYHGERGVQKTISTELLILALLLSIGGVVAWQLAPAPATTQKTAATSAPVMGSATAIPDKSIAVLPFENLSADKDNAYFATGMQDEILTRLAGIHELKVISRTSTEQYASHPPNLKVVAEQLGVATVLEGSVQKADGKVRINLQLIDAHTDSHLWAQNYDRDLKDVFVVQSDVAEKVADALKAQLLPAESARLASVPTQIPEAHDLFLKGQDLFDRLQSGTIADPVASGKLATEYFQRAIVADPKFALAFARLAYLQLYLHWYGVDQSPQLVELAQGNAEKALALQPGLPEAHLSMGYLHYWGHRNYAAALDEFARARTNLPGSAELLSGIAYVHRRQSEIAQAIRELQEAEALNPRASDVPREIANSYDLLRRYADADIAYRRSSSLLATGSETRTQHANSRLLAGDAPGAERLLASIPADMDPQGQVSLARFKLAMALRQPNLALTTIEHAPAWLNSVYEHTAFPLPLLRGQALMMKGESAKARASFLEAEQVLQSSLTNPVTASHSLSMLALVQAGLGERGAALKSANASVEQLPMSRDVLDGAFQLERRARVEAAVGAIDAAVGTLQQLMNSPSGQTVSVATLKIDPVWDPLRKDPRFQKLIADGESAEKAQGKP